MAGSIVIRQSHEVDGRATLRSASASITCRSAQGHVPAERAPARRTRTSRTDEYDEPERDTAVHTESDHMPSWAQDDARDYWDAADLFERANGRLYLSADFALPFSR